MKGAREPSIDERIEFSDALLAKWKLLGGW